MPKIKKTFDKESMYKKIMPSAIRQETQMQEEQNYDEYENKVSSIRQVEKSAMQNGATLFQNKEIKWINDSSGEHILYNITERLVINRLEIALKKMNCCRCDRCKKDIIAIALNNLSPHYAVSTSDNIDLLVEKDEKLGLEVTSAILKAILNIRKNPRH